MSDENLTPDEDAAVTDETGAAVAQRIDHVDIEVEMQRSYLDYAMSVIVGRALPEVRDGLKPVHRRILYAMYDGGYRPNAGFYKSMRVVGDVMSHYHPHGDAACTMRLLAWFSGGQCATHSSQVRVTSDLRKPRSRSSALHGVQDGPAGYGNGPRHRREHS